MLRDYVYKMYEDDDLIEDEGYDEDFPDFEEDEDSSSYSGYDDDDYENSDDEYEED